MHGVAAVVVCDDSRQVRKIKGSRGAWTRIARALPSRCPMKNVAHEDVVRVRGLGFRRTAVQEDVG